MATKTSILVFYLSLSKVQKVFRWFTIGTLLVVNLAGIALTFLNVFQCRPVGAAFDAAPPSSAHCVDIIGVYLSSSPVNISTDLAILFLPMPILTAMQLPKKQKIILIVTFGFGIFVAAIDVVRIAYLENAALSRFTEVTQHQSSSRNSEEDDFSWYASLSYMWSAVEVNLGIMCGCVPGLKPLVSRFLPHLLRDPGETSRKSSTTTGIEALDFTASQRIPSVSTPSIQARRTPPNATASQSDEPVAIMDFLTTPDMTELPEVHHFQRSETAMTNTTGYTAPATPNFFDFVNMKRKKSMVYMTNKESLFPVLMVTFLFLIWGFAYGLLDVLNSQFQLVARMSPGMTVGLHSAYYAGYLVAPLTFGRLVLRYWGFKACYTVGLVIYAIGTLVFWPASVLTSFPAFLVSNFIVGLGLSTLEIAANPFIALCGPQQYGEIRLNFSQGVQATGTIFAPLLANKVLFRNVFNAPSLIDVQWTYLSIALFMALLAFAYHYLPLPEATDAELADIAERSDYANDATFELWRPGSSPLTVKVLYITFALAVFSQFCYVGGQESVSTSFSSYMSQVNPSLNTINHQAIGHTAFAVGRFLAAFAGFFMKPRWILLFCYAGAVLFTALCMNFSGATPAALIIIVYLFEGPLFSLIFTTGLRGMGARTKDASALLTAAISGGAVFPPIMYAVSKSRGAQYSFCIVVAAFAAGVLLPLWINGDGRARRQVDHSKEERVLGRHTRHNEGHSAISSFEDYCRASDKKVKRWSDKIKRCSWKSGSDGGERNMVEHIEGRPVRRDG
ncbi:MAG: hypothetical protein Q9157_006929 [Trypethelium eluteriae]